MLFCTNDAIILTTGRRHQLRAPSLALQPDPQTACGSESWPDANLRCWPCPAFEMKVFAGADLTAYARSRLAPSRTPFPIARETARQMIRETKSATYPKIKITKAAITCSAILNGAKAMATSRGGCLFESNSYADEPALTPEARRDLLRVTDLHAC